MLAKAALTDANSNKWCVKLGKNSRIQYPSERDLLMGILTDALAPEVEGHVYQVRTTSVCCQVHRKSQGITVTFTEQYKVKHLQLNI